MDAEFRPLESFMIDDGQLDGLSAQDCFVLGYSLADVRAAAIYNPYRTEHFVRLENLERVKAALVRWERRFEIRISHNDVSEAWVCVIIYERHQFGVEDI